MAPVTLSSKFLDGSSKLSTHVSHTVSDGNELIKPLSTILGAVKDGSSNTSTMLGRRRVVASDDDLNLTHDTGSSSFILADKVESSSSLTIKTHDLGKRLSNDHLETIIKEVSKTVTILVETTTGESLVCSVKEWEKLVLLANFGNLVPLLFGWVNTSRVVSTGVEEYA